VEEMTCFLAFFNGVGERNECLKSVKKPEEKLQIVLEKKMFFYHTPKQHRFDSLALFSKQCRFD
jgi:hypothetical protein